MKKENKVLLTLFIAILFDMITTQISFIYFGIDTLEKNIWIHFLRDLHPLLMWIYIPFIVSLYGLMIKLCYKINLKVEGRTLGLFTSLMFVLQGIYNLGYLLVGDVK